MTKSINGTPDDVPPVIATFVESINSSNTEGFVTTFSENGYVDDWGTRYEGRAGVRQWAGSDAIGANARMMLIESQVVGDVVTTRFDWRSRKFNGESTGIFRIENGHIGSFTIPPGH